MIDIRFSVSEDKKTFILDMDGHAGAGEHGKDLVCASASMLAYTLAQNVTYLRSLNKLTKKPHIILSDGKASVICKPKRCAYAEVLHLYHVIQVGFSLLSVNFPDNVKLTMLESDDIGYPYKTESLT